MYKMDNTVNTISELVKKAREAQEKIDGYTQEQIDEVCLSVAWEVYRGENIHELARLAVEETGMGVYEDKVTKHKVKVLGVINDVIKGKSVGLIERDEDKKISKYAKPVGVVGALTPVTNPTATPASNAVSILKGRNAVIFAPHPKSKKSSGLAVEYMQKGLVKVGAPKELIQIIEEPSIELTNELMKQVDLVLATGGGPMVKAAYSSGTPSYGVGPGNSVQIIAEDADVVDAIKKVVISKTFDNATSCSSENSVIIHESIYYRALEEIKKNNGYICNNEERKKLEKWMWIPNKNGKISLNPRIIAKSAVSIAADAGFSVSQNIKMLAVEGTHPLENDRFSEEKISPVLTIWKCSNFEEAYDILKGLTDNCGTGHSCGIYTYKKEYIEYMALNMKTSRIMVRQPQAPANGGNFFNGMPSTVTLGCGTWGGNITTENINYKHFLNITWVSEPFEPVKPSDESIWGDFWRKHGK
jgi:sulfoacetaldehyde dehydrogenase